MKKTVIFLDTGAWFNIITSFGNLFKLLRKVLGYFLCLGRLRCPDDYYFSSLLGFGLLNGVPGACRAAHGDLDGATPRAAMLYGGWSPTKMAGCGYGRNIRKTQLLFEKCPHSILFFLWSEVLK